MLTNQQLMDLPGAGADEKQLRKEGRWKLTPEEQAERYIGDLEVAIDMAQSAQYGIERLYKEMHQ